MLQESRLRKLVKPDTSSAANDAAAGGDWKTALNEAKDVVRAQYELLLRTFDACVRVYHVSLFVADDVTSRCGRRPSKDFNATGMACWG